MTKTEIKAIKILDVEYGRELSARQFAEEMWPDSPGWDKSTNNSYGAQRGKGMWLAAGGYLRKLQRKGLVTANYDSASTKWRASHEGKQKLREALGGSND